MSDETDSVYRSFSGLHAVATLTVLSHPDVTRIGDRVLLHDLATGGALAISRSEPDFVAPGERQGTPLLDLFLSRLPFLLRQAEHKAIQLQIGESKTRVRAQGKPIPETRLFAWPEIERGVVLELSERVVLLLHPSAPVVPESKEAYGMIGESTGLARVRADIDRTADLDVPILVQGETGTGKELVARALHQSSKRGGKLVSVNLGAVPTSLAASELFGAVRGAFTGAVRQQGGYFRGAHGGTLFLDEVGEAPLDVQVMLLRALETGEIYPVGSQAPVRVDVRLIAATDSDLAARVEAGGFKAPLLHRLSSYEIWLPPLRERREDIGRLLVHFAREDLADTGDLASLDPRDPRAAPWIPAKLAVRLALYDWPGNIRQLRNVVRQLIIGSRGLASLRAGRLVEKLLRETNSADKEAEPTEMPVPPAPVKKKWRKPSTVSNDELVVELTENRWDLKTTADRLQISRTSLYALIEKHPDLHTAADLDPAEIERCYQSCAGDVDATARQLRVSTRGLRYRIKKLGLDSVD